MAVEPTAAAKMRPIRRAAGACRFHLCPLRERGTPREAIISNNNKAAVPIRASVAVARAHTCGKYRYSAIF